MTLAVLGACHHRPPPRPVPATAIAPVPSLPPERPWPGTVAAVRAAVDSGRFGTADSILAAFERSEPESPDVKESAFWRALLRADPRNPAFSPPDARTALEGYLATRDPRHHVEATVMLRMLALSDSLRTAQAAQRSAAESRDRAREEELQRLHDELQRTQAELDRIKRRLGQRKP